MLELLHYDFMIRALVAGMATAVIAPIVGMFLVTKRYAFMADTLAHVSFAGVAIGLFFGVTPILSAIVTAVIAALLIEQLRSSGKVMGESGLVLFLSGGLALASVLLSVNRTTSGNIGSLLFGSITTVTQTDVVVICVAVAVMSIVIAFSYRQLFSVTLDEELAAAGGIRTGLYNKLLVILAAAIVSLSMRIVGVLLVGALMVIPVLAATQLRQGFFRTLLYSICFSLCSVLTGLTLSYYAGFASGGTIVLVALGLFGVCALFSGSRR